MLRAAFGELRVVEAAMTPPMRVATEIPAVPLLAMRGFAAAMLALFVILTCATIVPTAKDPMPSSYVDMTSWKAPTDFLLETPQNDLLKTVPQFGAKGL